MEKTLQEPDREPDFKRQKAVSLRQLEGAEAAEAAEEASKSLRSEGFEGFEGFKGFDGIDEDVRCAAAYIVTEFDEVNVNESSLKRFVAQAAAEIVRSCITLKHHQVDFFGRAIMACAVLNQACEVLRALRVLEPDEFKAKTKAAVRAWNTFARDNTMYDLTGILPSNVEQCLRCVAFCWTRHAEEFMALAHDMSLQLSQLKNLFEDTILRHRRNVADDDLGIACTILFKTSDAIRQIQPGNVALAAGIRLQLVEKLGIHSCLSEEHYKTIKRFFSTNNVSHIFNVGGGYGMHSLLFDSDNIFESARIKTTTVDPYLTTADMRGFYTLMELPMQRKVSLLLPRWLALDGKSIKYSRYTNNLDNAGVFISWPDGGSVFGEVSSTAWLLPTLQNAIKQGVKYFVLVLSESAGLEAFNEFQKAKHLDLYQVQRTIVPVPALELAEEIIFIKPKA